MKTAAKVQIFITHANFLQIYLSLDIQTITILYTINLVVIAIIYTGIANFFL